MTLQNLRRPLVDRPQKSGSTPRPIRGILSLGRSARSSGGITLQLGWRHEGANWQSRRVACLASEGRRVTPGLECAWVSHHRGGHFIFSPTILLRRASPGARLMANVRRALRSDSVRAPRHLARRTRERSCCPNGARSFAPQTSDAPLGGCLVGQYPFTRPPEPSDAA
jgi:hypothetical protein